MNGCLQTNGGLITRDDLAAYAVREYDPLQIEYRGHCLFGLSPTSGSMTAFEALNILGHFDLARMGASSASAVHVIAEALRRAFLDRFAYLTDTDLQAVPVEGLIPADYARAIAATIAPDRANPQASARDPWRFQPAAAGTSGRPSASRSAGGDGCTTHLNVVDAERNMVACTSTLGDFALRQRPARVASLLRALHGRKRLITGNNDDSAVIGCGGWESIQPYAEVNVDGMHLVLCHYPFRTWRNMGKGWANLHGHSHGRLKPLPRQFDVGVEVWNFRPVQLAEVIRSMKTGMRGPA